MNTVINISEFDYNLVDEKIAKHPIVPRDSSKLLYSNSGQISHHQFNDISDLLDANTLLVFNNTKVIPARLYFKRQSGAVIEIFLLQSIAPSIFINEAMNAKENCIWQCVIGNKKKWKLEEKLNIDLEINASETIITAEWHNYDLNEVKISWNSAFTFVEIIEAIGNIPLPPYLNRKPEESDKIDYQTVFSTEKGAVAAPTAGLHFSEKVLSKITQKGIKKTFITLHVGAGTFLPVKTENVLEHPMHNEQIILTSETLNNLLDHKGKIIPIGTTAMRSLESIYWFGVKLLTNPDADFFVEKLFPYEQTTEVSLEKSLHAIANYFKINEINYIVGKTEIMIFPSYKFKVCDGLITNFHQPKSTLIMLVAALVGRDYWKKIYTEALNNNYRFLSFGDSSLLIP